LNTAFCDHVFGFAYYGIIVENIGLGQLRHSSNASGPQYGKRLKKEGVLGVYLNMDKGQLSFSLNGENMGVAFDNAALKKGPIYPAVALLHCAGCTIRGGLPIPACYK
jgi:E3 ubiquitin-protein ligase NRDP1